MGKVVDDQGVAYVTHWERLWLNIRHPFSINPLSHGGKRKGYQDFFHSLMNILVESARYSPWEFGHAIAYVLLACTLLIGGLWLALGVLLSML
jgi:hypothetical protein